MITNVIDLAGHAFPVLPKENTLELNQTNLTVQPAIIQKQNRAESKFEMGMIS